MGELLNKRHLAKKRQALVAQSDLNRKALGIETRNLLNGTQRARQNSRKLLLVVPAVLVALRLVGWIRRKPRARAALRGRSHNKSGFIGKTFLVWNSYQRFAPLINALLSHWRRLGLRGSSVAGGPRPAPQGR